MATITYKFADGHPEEIEVSEEIKAAYEELDKQEKRYYWKTNKQKARAGLQRQDFSLENVSRTDTKHHPLCPDLWRNSFLVKNNPRITQNFCLR